MLNSRAEVTGWMLIFSDRAPAVDPGRVRGPLQQTAPHPSDPIRPLWPDESVANLSQERIKHGPILAGFINEYQRAA